MEEKERDREIEKRDRDRETERERERERDRAKMINKSERSSGRDRENCETAQQARLSAACTHCMVRENRIVVVVITTG